MDGEAVVDAIGRYTIDMLSRGGKAACFEGLSTVFGAKSAILTNTFASSTNPKRNLLDP